MIVAHGSIIIIRANVFPAGDAVGMTVSWHKRRSLLHFS